MAGKKGAEDKASRVKISAADMPRRTLMQCVRIAEILHEVYAGKTATWDNVAKAMDVGAQSPNTKYLIWGAEAYGRVSRTDTTLTLAETGRKIVAPTYDGEDSEAKQKAVLTPTVLSKFYADYNGHPVPGEQHLPNVLETKFSVPRNRMAETIKIIIENAKDVGILVETDGKFSINLSGSPKASALAGQDAAGSTVSTDAVDTVDEVEAPTLESTCFYITPIGDEGSDVRKHADMMLKHLLTPVAKEFGLEVIRADKIERTGLITQQILQQLVGARLCVADLSFGNHNAFYELGVRHMTKLPTIQLIRKGDKIPFDVSQGRTITVDTSDVYTIMDRFESARRELSEHIKAIMTAGEAKGSEGNPIIAYLPSLKVTLPK